VLYQTSASLILPFRVSWFVPESISRDDRRRKYDKCRYEQRYLRTW